MDPQVFQHFQSFLPTEIVAEIDAHLIATYRRELTKKCADMIRKHVKYDINDEYTHIAINGISRMMFELCDCGEVITYKIAEGNKIPSTTHVECDCIVSVSASMISIGGGLIRYIFEESF